jgi:GNAT superfamily N-acetyltransferase
MRYKDVQWRTMTGFDLPNVEAIAAHVHPGFFEAPSVLAEKRLLYPNGAYLLEIGLRPVGYLLSHPWTLGVIPALNAPLGQLPAQANSFYIHDLALLPIAQGIGAARYMIDALTKHALVCGFSTMSLVAVNASQPFWEKHGFAVVNAPSLDSKLRGYEDGARYMVKRLF